MTQNSNVRILTWDWKEDPDVEAVARIVSELSEGRVHVIEADTGTDQVAWIFSTEPFDQTQATEVFNQHWREGT